MTPLEAPLLTTGIPLHRSRAVVDVVSDDIAGIRRPDVAGRSAQRPGTPAQGD